MKKRAFFYSIAAGVLWGTSGIFVHFLAPFGFSSLQMPAMRGVVSALSMCIFVLCTDRLLFKATLSELVLFAFSGISMFITASAYYAAMQKTSIATAVVLMYTAPIFVMIYSVAFLGEKLTRKKLVSVVVMLLGCVLVSGILDGLMYDVLGLFIGLISGIGYSAYNIFTKIQMRRGSHPITATMYTMIFMALFALAVSNPVEMVQITAMAPLALLPMILALGVCTGVLPYFLYTLALRTLPVGTASALGIIEPMAATLFGVVLGQMLDFFQGIGIVMILGAVFFLSRSEV